MKRKLKQKVKRPYNRKVAPLSKGRTAGFELASDGSSPSGATNAESFNGRIIASEANYKGSNPSPATNDSDRFWAFLPYLFSQRLQGLAKNLT